MYGTGTISATGADNGLTRALQPNSPIGPDGVGVVGVSGTYTGATIVVEGRYSSTSSVWYPLGGVNRKTREAVNGAAIALTNSGTDSFEFTNIAGLYEGRVRASAISTGGVVTEVATFPANVAATISTPVALTVATTPQTITSASATALAVGPNGTTNPAFVVDASTGSAATGLKVTAAAAAAGVAFTVVSSGTDENLALNAKGAGTVTIGAVSTGNVVIGGTSGGNLQIGDVGTIAAAGSEQGDAQAIVNQITHVSAADGTKGVVLPAAAAGLLAYVYNLHASNGLKVYPASGDDINDGTTDAAVTIEGKTLAVFVALDSTTWAATFTANT